MTSIDRPDRHPGAEELLDYFEQKLPDDVERGVEEHLAVCAECAAVGREVHAFHRVWLWTAAAHGKAQLRELLADAVRRAAAERERFAPPPPRGLGPRLVGACRSGPACGHGSFGGRGTSVGADAGGSGAARKRVVVRGGGRRRAGARQRDEAIRHRRS